MAYRLADDRKRPEAEGASPETHGGPPQPGNPDGEKRGWGDGNVAGPGVSSRPLLRQDNKPKKQTIMQNTDKIQTVLETCTPERAALIRKFLEKIEPHYSEAPASSSKGFHDAIPGGLAKHSLKVLEHLEGLAAPYLEKFGGELQRKHLVTVALLHDCHKACDAAGTPYYIPNVLKSGKVSEDKPYKVNPEYLKGKEEETAALASLSPVMAQRLAIFGDEKYPPGGTSSLELIRALEPELYKDLAACETDAIRWHDGGYGEARYHANGKEGILAILLHAADMVESRWDKLGAPGGETA